MDINTVLNVGKRLLNNASEKNKAWTAIMNDKSLNIWQKKAKWDALDTQYPGLPTASIPTVHDKDVPFPDDWVDIFSGSQQPQPEEKGVPSREQVGKAFKINNSVFPQNLLGIIPINPELLKILENKPVQSTPVQDAVNKFVYLNPPQVTPPKVINAPSPSFSAPLPPSMRKPITDRAAAFLPNKPSTTGQTLSTNDTPMKKKAEFYAQAYLDGLLSKPEYASLRTYMDDLDREEMDIMEEQDVKNLGAGVLNLIPNVITAVQQGPAPGSMPPWMYAGTIAMNTLGNTFSSPSLINTPLQPGTEYYNKLKKVKDKKEYLNSTPYKYIAFSDMDLYPTSRTYDFRNELEKQIENLKSAKIPVPIQLQGLSVEQSNEFRERYIGYLIDVLYMNKHRDEFYKNIDKAYNEINNSSP